MDTVLLTESNSGFAFQCKFNSLAESVRTSITESGMMLLKRVPCTVLEKKNKNGRKYSVSEMNKALKTARDQKLFESRSLTCTADDHPKGSYPAPIHSSHIVLDAYIEEVDGEMVLFNDWLVLDTDNGRNLQALVKAEATIGTSIRGTGRQNESTGYIEEYTYLGTDGVGNPSAGTMANFSEEVVVESVSAPIISQVESILESNKGDTVKVEEVRAALAAYREKHLTADATVMTTEMVRDMMDLQRQVVEFPELEEEFQSLSDDVTALAGGKKPAPLATESDDTNKLKDDLARATRRLESANIMIQSLLDNNTEIKTQCESLRDRQTAAHTVIDQLRARISEALEGASAPEGALMKEHVQDVLETLIADLQNEAREVITATEKQLNDQMHLNEELIKQFQAQSMVLDAMVSHHQAEFTTESDKTDDKKTSLSESVRTRTGARVNRQPKGWV